MMQSESLMKLRERLSEPNDFVLLRCLTVSIRVVVLMGWGRKVGRSFLSLLVIPGSRSGSCVRWFVCVWSYVFLPTLAKNSLNSSALVRSSLNECEEGLLFLSGMISFITLHVDDGLFLQLESWLW